MTDLNPRPTAYSADTAALIARLRANISFRFFAQTANVRNIKFGFEGSEFGLDLVNTAINDRSPLHIDGRLADMPRMSTLAIGYLINAIVGAMTPPCAYLNIGVWRGFTFFAGLTGNGEKTCIGVDNFSQFGGPRTEFLAGYEHYRSANSAFFDMDYELYLATHHSAPVGLYYYDGEHGYEHQFRALEKVESHLAADALIVVDDTNNEPNRRATLDFMASRPDQYALLLDERTFGNSHPTFWNGLMVIGRNARS